MGTNEFWQSDQERVIKTFYKKGAQLSSSLLPQVSADSGTFRGRNGAPECGEGGEGR